MIHLQKFTFNPFQENTFIVHNSTLDAIIIDPGNSSPAENNILMEFINSKKLKIKEVWLTHAHIDHILGLSYCLDTFNIGFAMHSLELENLNMTPKVAKNYGLQYLENKKTLTPNLLDSKTELMLGNEKVKIINTPGHSPGSVCFYFSDYNKIISGDVLFLQSIGRTDLPGGNYDNLEKSIREKLYVLPDQTIIYNGHGAETSIGYEKKYNQFIRNT